MSGRKPVRFAAALALMALAVLAGGVLGIESTSPMADFDWGAPLR